MNKQEFAKIMAGISAAYPNFKASKQTYSIWYESMKDLDYSQAAKAVSRIIRQEEYPPSVATIRKRTLAGENLDIDQMLMIYNESVSRYGFYRGDQAMDYIQQQSPIAYRVMKAFGYSAYCSADPNMVRGQLARILTAVVRRNEQKKILGSEELKTLPLFHTSESSQNDGE